MSFAALTDWVPTARLLEAFFVLLLFGGFVGLWHLKRRWQLRVTGHDPEVLFTATSAPQRFFAQAERAMTGAVVVLVISHAAFGSGSPFLDRVAGLESAAVDLAGLALGVAGLTLCFIAQRTMGSSWRVGIDERNPAQLVTGGIYRLIRNPTYLGLFAVNLGLWLIWPTPAIACFALLFYVLLEMQVRCEEEYLLALHGDTYRNYMSQSGRYLPKLRR